MTSGESFVDRFESGNRAALPVPGLIGSMFFLKFMANFFEDSSFAILTISSNSARECVFGRGCAGEVSATWPSFGSCVKMLLERGGMLSGIGSSCRTGETKMSLIRVCDDVV